VLSAIRFSVLNLYPNLSQYAANRAQIVQSLPNRVYSSQQLIEASQSAITRLLNRFGVRKTPTRVRIPPVRIRVQNPDSDLFRIGATAVTVVR
jgi:hypothetical protein